MFKSKKNKQVELMRKDLENLEKENKELKQKLELVQHIEIEKRLNNLSSTMENFKFAYDKYSNAKHQYDILNRELVKMKTTYEKELQKVMTNI